MLQNAYKLLNKLSISKIKLKVFCSIVENLNIINNKYNLNNVIVGMQSVCMPKIAYDLPWILIQPVILGLTQTDKVSDNFLNMFIASNSAVRHSVCMCHSGKYTLIGMYISRVYMIYFKGEVIYWLGGIEMEGVYKILPHSDIGVNNILGVFSWSILFIKKMPCTLKYHFVSI